MASQHQTLTTYRTKTDLVYEALRRSILAGRYEPGGRIVFDKVAAELGVSKVPVREAVVRLIGEGLLQSTPHVGAAVPILSPDEILEISVIRAVLQGAAIRNAVDNLTRTTLRLLRAQLVRMDKATANGDPAYPELNWKFHTTAFGSCRYPALRDLAMSLADKHYRLRTVRFLPEYLPESQAEHWALFEALSRRDGVAAERITREHIERAGRLLWQFALTTGEKRRPKSERVVSGTRQRFRR
jgi:DNA-binding GntR family transcriptional regulator